jgi:hypothetical protein
VRALEQFVDGLTKSTQFRKLYRILVWVLALENIGCYLRVKGLIIAMESRRAVKDIVGGEEVIGNGVQSRARVGLGDVSASKRAFLSLGSEEEDLVALADADLVSDGVTVLEPEELGSLIRGHFE